MNKRDRIGLAYYAKMKFRPYASGCSVSGVGSSSLPPLLTSFNIIQRCSQSSAFAALLVLQVYFRQVAVLVPHPLEPLQPALRRADAPFTALK